MYQFSTRNLIVADIIPNFTVIKYLNLRFFHRTGHTRKHKTDISAGIRTQIRRVRAVISVRITASAGIGIIRRNIALCIKVYNFHAYFSSGAY